MPLQRRQSQLSASAPPCRQHGRSRNSVRPSRPKAGQRRNKLEQLGGERDRQHFSVSEPAPERLFGKLAAAYPAGPGRWGRAVTIIGLAQLSVPLLTSQDSLLHKPSPASLSDAAQVIRTPIISCSSSCSGSALCRCRGKRSFIPRDSAASAAKGLDEKSVRFITGNADHHPAAQAAAF